MWWLACVLALSALVVHLVVIGANMRQPAHLPLAAALGTIGFPLAGMVAWAVSWQRRFRPPSRSNP